MPHSSNPAVTLSLRVSTDVKIQLESLADATGRTKSFLAAEAIQAYVKMQTWQVNAIKQAVKRADDPNAKFIDHEEVIDWLASWGDSNEKEPPK